MKTEKNICMFCGNERISRFRYRVLDTKDLHRDFCSEDCLIKYYTLVLNQNIRKSRRRFIRSKL